MPFLFESYSPGEERNITIVLEGTATTEINLLTVRTDIGEYDILAGETPKARYNTNVFILASMKNIGDIPAPCTLKCTYPLPLPTLLYEISKDLEPGEACGIECISHTAKHPIIMPARDITIKVTCSP